MAIDLIGNIGDFFLMEGLRNQNNIIQPPVLGKLIEVPSCVDFHQVPPLFRLAKHLKKFLLIDIGQLIFFARILGLSISRIPIGMDQHQAIVEGVEAKTLDFAGINRHPPNKIVSKGVNGIKGQLNHR